MSNTPPGFRPPDYQGWPPSVNQQDGARGQGYRVIKARKNVMIWAADAGEEGSVVCKLYHHRGPVSWAREHWFRFRVQREYDALAHLHGRGVPCSPPLYWSKGRASQYGQRFELLVTRELPGVVPLRSWLQETENDEAMPCLRRACRLIRQMHEAGVHHGAMYLRNILIDTRESSAEAPLYLIDMPKAVVLSKSLVGSRLARIDLLDFCRRPLQRLGEVGLDDLLQAYGLTHRDDRARLIAAVARYRTNRHVRDWNRFQGTLMEFMGRADR